MNTQSLLPQQPDLGALRTLEEHISALARLNELSSRLWRQRSLDAGLAEMLHATIELLGADKGNIQILSEDGILMIVAQRGFEQEFLNFFRQVSVEDDSTCARALRSGHRIMIEDVETDDRYKLLRDVARSAGYRAVQSTPLLGRNDKLLGMLSTHWIKMHRPTEVDWSLLDLYARQAADFIERLKIDEAMSQSEARFRELVERSPFGTYVVDSHLRILHMNDAGQHGAFRNVRPIIGRDFSEAMRILWPEPVATDIIAIFRHTLETGTPYGSRDFLNPRADVNQTEAYEWELHRVTLPDGQYGVICYYFDSTTLRHTEHALRESEERLRLAQQAARIGTFEWNIQTHVHTWTPELEALYALKPGEFGQTQVAWEQLIHPEDRDATLRLVEQSLITGEPTQGEWRVVWPDATVHWLGGRWQVFKDGSGKLLRMRGIHFDMTERKQAEEALRQSEERFSRFMQHIPGPAWIKDMQGRYIYANKATEQVFHASEEKLYGRTDEELFAPTVAAQFKENDRRVLVSGMSVQVVETLEHADGVLHHSLVSKFPIPGPDGQTTLVGGMAVDITERKQVEEALREAQGRLERWTVELEQAVASKTAELLVSQERLRELAAELTLTEHRERKRLAAELHDHLAQLLVLIRFKLSLAKQGPDDRTVDLVYQADALLNEALTYTRELVAQVSPSVLHDFGLPAALSWLGEEMKQFGMTITIQIETPEDLNLSEDRAILLFQSTRELLINTAKHAGTKDATLRLAQNDSILRITVQDQGRGFDATGTQKRNSRVGSSKFGLFSIRERMYAMGGRCEIYSAIGEGTIAALSLPYQVGSQPQVTGVVSSSPVEPSCAVVSLVQEATGCRILIVDDLAMVRQGLRSLMDGYANIQVVGEAQNGLDAVNLVEELRPRVVVMDVNMPTMNGIEATAKIKTRWPEIIVIGVSVNASPDSEDAMRKAGAVRLITKEAAVEELYGAIQQALKDSETPVH